MRWRHTKIVIDEVASYQNRMMVRGSGGARKYVANLGVEVGVWRGRPAQPMARRQHCDSTARLLRLCSGPGGQAVRQQPHEGELASIHSKPRLRQLRVKRVKRVVRRVNRVRQPRQQRQPRQSRQPRQARQVSRSGGQRRARPTRCVRRVTSHADAGVTMLNGPHAFRRGVN